MTSTAHQLKKPKNPTSDLFVKRILTVLGEGNLTAKLVFDKYTKTYPPSFFKRIFKPSIEFTVVDVYLKKLVEYGFASQEIAPWTESKKGKVEVILYSITNMGRDYLNIKGK